MPRPTPAQLAYGSATVVLSTLAMLLLSEARSGVSVVIIASAGLLLGVLVAVTTTIPLTARARARSRSAVRATHIPVPRPRVGSSGRSGQPGQSRVSEHSLRR